MNSMNLSKDMRLYVRIALVCLFVGILLYSFWGEKQPYNDGQGWDGRLYYQMCNHSLYDITHHGYSAYYVQRFLPFAVVNGLQMVFGYEHTMFFMLLVAFVALMIGVWGFFKISNYLQLRIGIETIAFALLFFHNRVVLWCGYSPYSTDVFALVLGIWFYYYFVKKQKLGMMCVAFIGAFVWQSMWPLSCILFALPWDSYVITQPQKLSTLGEKSTEFVKVLLLTIPIMCIIYLIKICIKHNIPISDYGNLIPYFWGETSILGLTLSVIGFMGYILYVLSPIHFDLFDGLKNLFKSLKVAEVIGAVMCFCLMYGIVHFLADSSIENPISFISSVRRLMWEPLAYPVKFLEGHFVIFGMTIIFGILYYKQILQVAEKHSYGYLFCLIYIMALGSQTEVRFIINMLPFMVFAIASVLNQFELRKCVAPVIIGAQLVLSHFWFHFNTPELLATTITEDDRTYFDYPIQRLFEFSGGPWQSAENYYKWMSIFAVTLLLAYILHKKKLIYKIPE